MSTYEPVIGLEIHVELATKNKMFCQCAADWFGKDPNTLTCPVCLGMPGALPVPNRKAIEWTILIGKALNCTINKVSKFDRKHYFYPDLPKGYQISQYDEPIAINGSLTVGDKKFRIRRVHLEEDTGKLMHKGSDSLVDFNRSGVPLVEIVTEPDFHSSSDAKAFLEELHTIIQQYLQVSDANMEQGSMRLEPNISLRISNKELGIKNDEQELPNYKVEVKNINSFRYVAAAIDYEIERQSELLEKGETPIQETRGYNENKKITFSQRSKEEAHDYRYFPEPDIPPLSFDSTYIEGVQVPELPAEKRVRYSKGFALRDADTQILAKDKKLADYFEEVVAKMKDKNDAQKVANLLINKRVGQVSPEEFIEQMTKPDQQALDEKLVQSVIEKNKQAAEDYKNGKENALIFLVGQVMRELGGKADPQVVKKSLLEKISNS